ncbi:Type II secretion system protein D [Hydrogenovibrio crunogenus]|uniref:Type II secretion system protein D n=1 Tax=Hydrogenovibrio crunogenus TaxID=39765 RepID=A0A4V1C8P7_9GAMM|nr:pilus (MSHA type) biogenesis protein MshL [Hydrogenovibrio crunogenus]QBZ82644.1 Type II secretion system protein D [Hydrogenovibrio crunogenus]
MLDSNKPFRCVCFRTLILTSLVLLVGCGAETVKRKPLAPPVSDKFEIHGHLEPRSKVEEVVEHPSQIPDLVTVDAINVNPTKQSVQKLYSVSAIEVPVADLLFNLAKDADKQLDLSSDVQGLVTINAINQPLESIMERIVDQVGAAYEISYGTLRIKLDKPYWKSYEIDYVNVIKNIKDLTVMKMSVGNVSKNNRNNTNQASEFTLESSAIHDFWDALQSNIASMARLDPQKAERDKATTPPVENDVRAQLSADSKSRKQFQNVVVNREAGMLSVYTTAKKHQQVKNYLDSSLNRTNKQVLIEATVVEVELSDQYQAGVDWSAVNSNSGGSSDISQSLLGTNLSKDPNFSINLSSIGTWNFNVGIKMLQQFGDAKVLSSPKIMAMNNQAALLKVVNNEVYFTIEVNRESATASSAGVTTYETTVHTVPVGFMMHVTPFISDDEISLNIRPTLSRIVGYVNDPNPDLARESIESKVPIIQEREMDSVLRLRNRQTAIIGGLIQDIHDNQRQGVPGLSDLPWVGDLFSYRDDTVKKSELIIFIRPIIVTNPDVDYGDLQAFKPLMKTKIN